MVQDINNVGIGEAISDDQFEQLQTNFENGITSDNKEDFINSLQQDIQDPAKFNAMVTSLQLGDKDMFVEACSVPEGTVRSIVQTPEEEQLYDGVMESAESDMTPVELATTKAITELQSLPPEAAMSVINRLAQSSSNPEEFSQGMMDIYNAKGLDLSEFAFATQCYFSQLRSLVNHANDFSAITSVSKRLVGEYNSLYCPSNFSIFEAASRVMNHLTNFAEDTSMTEQAVQEEDPTGGSIEEGVQDEQDAQEEEAAQQMADEQAQAEQPQPVDPAVIDQIYNDMLLEYKALPSEDAKREYLRVLLNTFGLQAAQEFSEVSDALDAEDAEDIDKNAQADFTDDETAQQISDIIRNTPEENKEEVIQQIQEQYQIPGNVMQYIVAKSNDVAYSQGEDEGDEDEETNPYLAQRSTDTMVEDATVPEIVIPEPCPMNETEIMSIEDGNSLEKEGQDAGDLYGQPADVADSASNPYLQ